MDYRVAYQEWLNMVADCEAEKAELLTLDEKEIEDRFYTDLSFGTAGMRGVMAAGRNRMNVYTVRRASAALAKLLLNTPGGRERGVVVAYDSRLHSDEFAREAALVLCAYGVKTRLFTALRPVPMLSFAVRDLSCMAGVVITASHNPKQYNGYKVYWEDGGQLPPDRAEIVQNAIADTAFADAVPMDEKEAVEKGLLIWLDESADESYQTYAQTLLIDPERDKKEGGSLKIVYSPLHGSGNVPVRAALKRAGFTDVTVVPQQELPDPAFSTVKVPNPEEKESFKLALQLAEEVGADVVFATDPDCDRVGLAVKDKNGEARALTGNEIGCLLLHYVLSRKQALGTLPKNAAAVKSIVTTEMARRICEDFGVEMVDVLTGFKFIAEKIEQFETSGEYSFVFGFEESCGYLSGTRVRDKDGVNACLLIAEAALYYRSLGMTLYDALEEIFKKYGYHSARVVSVTLPGLDGLDRMRGIMTSLRQNPPARIGGVKVLATRDYLAGFGGLPTSDVIYFELEDGAWLCVRPSGTEPKIKLYANSRAAARDDAQALAEKLARAGKEMLL